MTRKLLFNGTLSYILFEVISDPARRALWRDTSYIYIYIILYTLKHFCYTRIIRVCVCVCACAYVIFLTAPTIESPKNVLTKH